MKDSKKKPWVVIAGIIAGTLGVLYIPDVLSAPLPDVQEIAQTHDVQAGKDWIIPLEDRSCPIVPLTFVSTYDCGDSVFGTEQFDTPEDGELALRRKVRALENSDLPEQDVATYTYPNGTVRVLRLTPEEVNQNRGRMLSDGQEFLAMTIEGTGEHDGQTVLLTVKASPEVNDRMVESFTQEAR